MNVGHQFIIEHHSISEWEDKGDEIILGWKTQGSVVIDFIKEDHISLDFLLQQHMFKW